MTETTTQVLSPGTKDELRKAADIIWESFIWDATPSGYDYWHNAYIKLYELSGAVPSFCPRESTTGKVGKGEVAKEGSGYSKKIGDRKKFDTAAYYISGMRWVNTSSGDSYWCDVYERVRSFKHLGADNFGATAEQITNEQKMAKEAKKVNQSGLKFELMTVCVCGHAYHTHSKKRGCKFRTRDRCFKFAVGSDVGTTVIEPLTATKPKPEDFLEL